MNRAKLLYSGYDFAEDEQELRLKYLLFNCLIGSNVILVAIAGVLRFATGNTLQGTVDFSYVVLATLIALIARQSKKYFPALILCILLLSLVVASLTYRFLSSDIAGVSWFIVLILVAFYLADKRIAYTLFALTFLLAGYLSYVCEERNYTLADILYGTLPLLATFIFGQFYEIRNALSRDRLRVINRELSSTTNELSTSEEKFRNLVENLSDWVWEMNQEGIYSYVSPSVKQILGYDPEDIEGNSHRSFLYKKNRGEK